MLLFYALLHPPCKQNLYTGYSQVINSFKVPVDLQKTLASVIRGLMEQTDADAVRIFLTRHDVNGTEGFTEGGGNVYAQEGMVREWLTRQDEETRERQRNITLGKILEEQEGESDSES